MANGIIRPMLAAREFRKGDLWTPEHEKVVEQHITTDGYLIVQPKWDGFRLLMDGNVARSRSWKPQANEALQKFAQSYQAMGLNFNGLDGEVFTGHNYHSEAFRSSMSDMRAAGGSGNIMIAAYDYFRDTNFGYTARRDHLRSAMDFRDDVVQDVIGDGFHVKLLLTPQVEARTLEEIYNAETMYIGLGFEGAIVRRPHSGYKYNRATAIGGELVKVKRRENHDAQVIGYEERLYNANEATTSELGYTTRSSHKENLLPTGMLGVLLIRWVNGPFKGVEQKVGVFRGLTHTDLRNLWNERESLMDRYCEVSVDGATGGYDAARQPVWLRWRQADEF